MREVQPVGMMQVGPLLTLEVCDLASLSPELVAFNNAPALMAQAGSVFALCFVIVSLRFYVRAMILGSFGADDWTMLLAFVLIHILTRDYQLTLQGFGFSSIHMLCA
jgi:hypothetical protein